MVRLPVQRERTVVLAPGSIHVNMATVSVAFAREMAALHLMRGIGYVAAPAGVHGIAAAGFIGLITSTLFAGSPVYKGYGGMIAEERYSPAGFKLALGQKDVRLAVEAGQAHGLPLAFGAALQMVLQEAVDQGDADLDLAALWKNAALRGQ
jgi:3-hydroxyisobutyrate dehydrogenase-like beta-hydroxyacid dehydrogenase